MAATTIMVATAVGTTAYSSRQAKKAARAQSQASGQAIDAMTAAEERALEMQRPTYEAGYAATAAMMDMAGLDRSRLGESARVSSARDRGVLMGDTLLPEGTYSDSPSNKRGSNIFYNGQRIGHVVPGGPNGRFVNDTGFDVDGTFRSLAGSATAAASPADLSSYERYNWQTDPGYQFRLDEGMRALERSAAARGVLASGGTMRGALRYAQDYASNEYQRVFDRIATIAGRGQSAASQASNVVVNTGQGVGNALINAGESRASGYIAQGNAWANAASQGAMLYGYMNAGRNAPISTPPYAGGAVDTYGYYRGSAVGLA